MTIKEKEVLIQLNNVSKMFNVYRKNIDRIKGVLFGKEPAEVKHALNNISMEVKAGEHVVVMGVVDSGRSTLAKVISGITLPSKGKVCTFGNKLNVMIDSKVGLDMEFSCRDNIYMKANIVGLTRREIEPYVDEILEAAEITNFADLPLKRAPKGTASILSTAVHTKKDADILICDEVFGGGGIYVSTKCEDMISKYLEERKDIAAVIISNRSYSAKKIATRGIVLHEGRIVFDGRVEEARKVLSEISRNRRTLDRNNS